MKNNVKNTKKLKILLLTDRMSLGGAETHVLSLYHALISLGHSVTVVSSGGALSQNINHVRLDLSSHSPIKIIRGYFSLYSLVKREGFDLIHAHARLPAFIASLVSNSLKIPLVTTVHARFKLDFLRRKFSRWGFRSIAVSEDLRLYLSQGYSIPAETITVIENGIDFNKYSKRGERTYCVGDTLELLFLSRLDFDCSLPAELLCEIAPRLAKNYKNIRITIGGGGEELQNIKQLAKNANLCSGFEIIHTVGEVDDVSIFLAQGDAFIGVSRCAIEAIATKIPVIIAGNEGFLGRLTPKNFEHALCSNFCARGEASLNADLLFEAICAIINDYSSAKADAETVYSLARQTLDISALAPKYEEFYRDTLEYYAHFKERTAKSLLFGYYGFSNLGDDALLRIAIKRARSEFGESVGALTHKPKKTAKRFAIPCYSRASPFSVIYRLLKCNRLILGGGTVFQDSTSRRSLLYYFLILRLALLLKKDVLLYANGIGGIRDGCLKRLLFSALERCSYLGVRDERSYALLKSSLNKSSHIFLEPDLSLYLPTSPISRARYLIYSSFKELKYPHSRCNSFFVVCPHFCASRFDRFELDIAIRKQKSKGETPLFIPCSPYDVYLCRHLRSKYGGGAIYSSDILSFSELLSIFSLAKCVISMRYHPLLAARICSTEAIVIGSDPKIEEFNVEKA